MSMNNALPVSVKTFPLMDALIGRRSRRMGLGMSIPDGPLKYASGYEPLPLTEQERALLVFAATGITGWNLGMPYTASGDPAKGSNYPLRHVGRTAPSAAGIESAEVLIADDSGTYISQTRNASPEVIEAAAAARTVEELIATTTDLLVQLSSERLEIPAAPPHVTAHNRWSSTVPGSTLIVPIVDMTEVLLDFLSIFTGEGVILWDMAGNEPVGDPRALISAGVLNPEARIPIQAFDRLIDQQATVETGLMAYNAQLMLQAMGLGGWLYGGVDFNSFLGAHSDAGIAGFGFDFTFRPEWGVPNPIGRETVFETLVSPYVAGATDAVARFAARKFGVDGLYDLTGHGPYRDNAEVKAGIERYSDETLTYFVSVLEGLEQRFGRYPGTIPTVLTSVLVQAQHVDTDYYDTFHRPEALLPTHREHLDTWHPGITLRSRIGDGSASAHR